MQFDDTTNDHIPEALSSFFRWLIIGPKTSLDVDSKVHDTAKRVDNLSQMTMSNVYTNNQIRNKRTNKFSSRICRYMLQQVASHTATA